MLDATYTLVNIRYTQDHSLLNEARKEYLKLAKSKKKSDKKIRATIRKQLCYVKRDVGYLECFLEEGCGLKERKSTVS